MEQVSHGEQYFVISCDCDAHIFSQSHPKAKPWHTKPFPLYNEMADLVDGSCALGKRKYRPKKRQEETPKLSILINPIFLTESSKQEKVLDAGSDSNICFMSLALSLHLYTFRAILPRTLMKTRPTQMTTPKETRAL